MFKNALISVSKKDGLIEFVKPLVSAGMRIVSSGGTAKFLSEHGIKVVEVSEQTGFPEMMGGRVKTLHPNIHMPILARAWEPQDFSDLGKYNLQPFDLVVCNLYPFEKAVQAGASDQDLIEKIDIGGPTLLRAAAKNYNSIAVVCDPADYPVVLSGGQDKQVRKRLAAKAFSHVSAYDNLIAATLDPNWKMEWGIAGRQVQELRYGENPDQSAAWYSMVGAKTGLQQAKVLQGKTLSYNNLLDLEAASTLVQEFSTKPACVAVKHNNPCGVAENEDSVAALDLVLTADPISVFGAIIACNFTVTANHAEQLCSCFLECVLAPEFTEEALAVFSAKKNLRILAWPEMMKAKSPWELRTLSGGFLLQSTHRPVSDVSAWRWVGEKPAAKVIEDMVFAEKVVASLKSNAIAVVKDKQSIGLGMGQVNRVDAVAQALERCHKFHDGSQDLVLASDAFFPFSDSLEIAAKAGVKWVLQPGGSLKDEEVIAKARELGIVMALSGVRHFRH